MSFKRQYGVCPASYLGSERFETESTQGRRKMESGRGGWSP